MRKSRICKLRHTRVLTPFCNYAKLDVMDMQRCIQIRFCLFMGTNVCNANSCSGKACQTKVSVYQCFELNGRCTCNRGYFLNSTSGDCEDLDECASHYNDPCGHRGRCTNSVGGYFCNCLHGWTNNTHCIPEKPNVDFTLCMPGYEGSRCSQTICEHGFAEPIGMNDFSCACSPGWEKQGDSKSPCNIDVNECLLPGVCNKNQICINSPGSYTCECYPSWTGNDCATYNCSQGGCQNGGTCLRGRCICPASVTGPTCTEIVAQDVNCTFDNNSFCGWKNSHTGDNFDWTLYHGPTPSAGTGPSVDHSLGNSSGTYAFIETSTPRQSNESAWLQSPLITQDGERYCLSFWYNMFGPSIGQLTVYISGNTVTPPGKVVWSQSRDQGSSWLNANIEINATDPFMLTFEGTVGEGNEGDIALDDIAMYVGHCVSLSTVSYQTTNFTRMSVPNTMPTTTPHGMHGTGCYGNPCFRGVCYVHLDEYFCLCPSGFEGRNCQIDADECRSQPCKNGGTCEDDVDNFMCHCEHGYTGKLCETEVDECLSQPCQHGGRCVDGLNHYTCMCLDGFDGEHCQNVLDPCYDSPCMRGTCFSHSSLFLCVCPPGYSGKFCEKVQI